MGARLIKQRGPSPTRRKEEFKALAMILCAVTFPLVLAYILVAADMRTDLSDLMPSEALADPSMALVGWEDLEIPRGKSASLEQSRWQPERRVRMLGYMMDADKPARDGAPVEMFVLMPEAGQILHPAHHIPDQMVEVRVTRPTTYHYRSLVWATGFLSRTNAGRYGDRALYSMADADVAPAVQGDITLWFKP